MIGEIGELIEIFPYFQSAHMLLLKGLHDVTDVKFEKQLRKSAIHIANREVLYSLLKTQPEIKIESASEMQATDRVESGHADNQQSVSESATENQDSDTDKSGPADNQQTVIESGRSSDDLINEIEKESQSGMMEEQSDSSKPDSGHTILVSTESEHDEPESIMIMNDEESEPFEEKVVYLDPGFSVPVHIELLELEPEETNLQGSGPDSVTGEHVDLGVKG